MLLPSNRHVRHTGTASRSVNFIKHHPPPMSITVTPSTTSSCLSNHLVKTVTVNDFHRKRKEINDKSMSCCRMAVGCREVHGEVTRSQCFIGHDRITPFPIFAENLPTSKYFSEITSATVCREMLSKRNIYCRSVFLGEKWMDRLSK